MLHSISITLVLHYGEHLLIRVTTGYVSKCHIEAIPHKSTWGHGGHLHPIDIAQHVCSDSFSNGVLACHGVSASIASAHAPVRM